MRKFAKPAQLVTMTSNYPGLQRYDVHVDSDHDVVFENDDTFLCVDAEALYHLLKRHFDE